MRHSSFRRIVQILGVAVILAAFTGGASAAPSIAQSGNADFGDVTLGTNLDRTFTITNSGDATANIDSITVTGAGFATQGSIPASVGASGGTATFKVRFTPAARQDYTGTVTITSAGSTGSPISIPLTGTGVAPEISVVRGSSLTSGVSTVTFSDVTLNGAVNTASTSLTFTINNTGTSTLNLSGSPIVDVSGTHASDFSVTTQPAATVAATSGTTTFTVQFTPGARGTRSATLSIANDDPDGSEAPFLIDIEGVGKAPQIALEQPAGTSIANNGSSAFGDVVVGATATKTFTIKNPGNAPLNLTGSPAISVDGTNATEFKVQAQPSTIIPGSNGFTTFVVEFTPEALGARSAALHITNTDPDGTKSPYNINLTGTAIAPPSGTDGFEYKFTTIPQSVLTLKDTDPDVVNANSLQGDDKALAVNLGFNFSFYENTYSTCSVSTNGLISFSGQSTRYTPDTTFPNANSPDNIIAPFWTDLQTKTGSKILYATRGAAPDRVFILEFQNMAEFGNTSANISFQVLLYEGSNAIEFQYRDISGFSTTRQVGIGIEDSVHVNGIALPRPTTLPTAYRISRPVVVELESTYLQPGNPTPVTVGSSSNGMNPDPQTQRVYKKIYDTTMRFEAPSYIYLNSSFSELSGAGDVNDPNPNNIAWYRLANDGYAINGQAVQGARSFVEVKLKGDLTFVWRWELEYAVNVKFGGVGTPVPIAGRTWYKANSPLTASVDTLVDSESTGVRLKTIGYQITTFGPTGAGTPAQTYFANNPSLSVGTRANTMPLTIVAPLELEWLVTGQVRYRFSANSNVTGQSDTPFDGLPFVRVYNGASPPVTTYGSGNNTDVWINVGADRPTKVEVGAFYRTPDDAFTLTDFMAPPGGDLAPLGTDISGMEDKQVPERTPLTGSRTARVYSLSWGPTSRPYPTEIHWIYQPTIFRAEVPLGMAFDPTQTIPPLIRTVAPLTNRVLSDAGPVETSFTPVGDLPTGKKSAGTALRWDKVDFKLYPVHPATNRLTWADKNDLTKSYKIEIVSGYPGQTVNLTSEREAADGTREGTAPAYVTQTTLSTIDVTNPGVGFPGQAGNAHYNHLFDTSVDRRPPTKLDISQTDEWKFQEVSYTDNGTDATAAPGDPGVPFNSAAPGRSVLLYSYRPNPDEIADGNLSKEKLAVRVIRSSLITQPRMVQADSSKLVLGRRALELGGGSSADRGAHGVVQASGTTTVDMGTNFLLDFWLNLRGLQDNPVTVAGCVTNGTDTVTCSSTSGLVAGMSISGATIATGTKIASITNATTFVLSEAASDSGSDLTLTASGKPVTLLTTKDDRLKVTLDPVGPTITVNYFGATVTKAYPMAGASWRHHVIHVFANQVSNGPEATVLDYYIDGVRDEAGFVTTTLKGLTDTASFDVSAALTANSLRFGVDADSTNQLQMDQVRLFTSFPLDSTPVSPVDPWLSNSDVHQLRVTRRLDAGLRGALPLLWFSFDKDSRLGTATALASAFANSGTSANFKIGAITDESLLARTDIQEVATRLESTLDDAGFKGTGYILNRVSNYNPNIYRRNNEVGAWGTIFPVNANQVFTDSTKRLEIAYYENPYRTDRYSHPNVAWPYEVAAYTEMKYPAYGPHRDKAIYIASRIGSEGVDQKGRVQQVFSLDKYSDLAIYNQPLASEAGYNPNEEHALVAQSGRAALKLKNLGEDTANAPPLAAFALQSDLNATITPYTSSPWVLVQVNNLVSGEPEMAAYQVFQTRAGTDDAPKLDFPRPSDSSVGATPGLAYEAASTPESRFLITDVSKTFNFKYEFKYNAFAGDLLIPPYPLNLVIGNVAMSEARGNSIQVNGINQRTLWRDVNKNAWIVSGNGRFFHQFFYPFRADFYLPGNPEAGKAVAWVPEAEPNNAARKFTGNDSRALNPVKVVYDTFWRSDYPKMKRGETLTYQGGEYFAETPGAKGLPALVAMKATELVYDSATPSMIIGNTTPGSYAYTDASARIIRPLDRREKDFTVANMGLAGFTPAASTKIFIVAERWYFKELPGSLQKRFYFNSLEQKLVFRGYLNDKDSGNKDLTVGPDPLNILEPNVLTPADYALLRSLATTTAWTSAIDDMYLLSQNPHGAAGANTSATAAIKNMQGFKTTPGSYPRDLMDFWLPNLSGTVTSPTPALVPLDSFGVGSALIPNQNLLTQTPTGSLYITIAENNRSELNGAPVSLHIIEIIPDRYRGAIKVIEAADAFSEKVSLQHNGEFGGNTGDLYYEWWVRDASSLDEVAQEVLADGTLKKFDSSGNTLWQEYLPKSRLEDNSLSMEQKHYGLNSIVFEGRPDVVLADKLVLMRYRHKNEASWNLVPFEVANRVTAWKPGTPAPFQWAGAANSPQLQADGSKRYIPQLVMGWVKRVLDRINPYEARYTDFFSNESPATYSSQIQIAGAPYAGNVALNPDKNVIENTGLIELYMTVLNRAKSLSIDNSSNGAASDGIKQALLLAATRLSVLYELLGSEAYSDAQDSTINAGEDGSLLGIASYTHAFQNMESDLMHEELSLLRGTDFLKSFPVYNRLFWNYAKGLGEPAYNVNYNIYDANSDGFINENDARKLYPQGHGDAWGHYLSAIDMHYTLLQHPGFTWKSRSELYSLMQNVLEVDYLDEKSFAKLAAAKARTGRDIVRGTYRMNYTQNPDGQWQGYTDGADPARAWGVSEWAHRAGQAAWFDAAVANALLPENAAGTNPENLDRLERSAAVDEIGQIAGGLHEIQVAMDEANYGLNPLGLDSDSLTFDIELQFYDNSSGGDRRSHFEQVLSRAEEASGNALSALEFATQASNKLRALGDDTDALIQEAMSQDLDYRNQLIEIFGRPYTGTIGFGKAYPEGYEGPDTLLFAYLDKTKINQIVPPIAASGSTTINFNILFDKARGSEIMNQKEMTRLYNKMDNNGKALAFESLLKSSSLYRFGTEMQDLSVPYVTASRYAFQAPTDWGQRTSYGTLQGALQDMLTDEIELDSAVSDYVTFLRDFEEKIHRLQSELEINDQKEDNKDVITGIRAGFSSAIAAIDVGMAIANIVKKPVLITAEALSEALPTSLGFSNDVTSAARGAAVAASYAAVEAYDAVEQAATIAKTILELVRDEIIARKERDNEQLDTIRELEGMIEDLTSHIGSERPLRNAIGSVLQNMEIHRQAYVTAQATGFRLLREREAFNKILASKVQKNRYQDMIFRMSRNEALSKYQTAFDHAASYAWLAARAYDYETSLDAGHPAAPGTLLDKIVKERQLGLWVDGSPVVGNGGLAEILGQLKSNFRVLKGQLGINNPQAGTEQISLRSELFRIMNYDQEVYDAFDTPLAQRTPEQADLVAANPDALGSRARWQDALKARIVPDLNKMPEFVNHCRPVGPGVQPGLVIRFPTCIEAGRNFFGLQLAAGDHTYSMANFATKIQTFGVQLEHYTDAGLSISPRAYLVPVGNDYLRTSTTAMPVTRSWKVVEERIPVPYTINLSNLSSPNYIPTLDGVDGVFGEVRRHGDFRLYHDDGDEETLTASTRLVGRSVWNSEWLLIIPGVNLHFDPNTGLQSFADNVSDIKLYILTYSHTGQ